jgi:hypothetical protein
MSQVHPLEIRDPLFFLKTLLWVRITYLNLVFEDNEQRRNT